MKVEVRRLDFRMGVRVGFHHEGRDRVLWLGLWSGFKVKVGVGVVF